MNKFKAAMMSATAVLITLVLLSLAILVKYNTYGLPVLILCWLVGSLAGPLGVIIIEIIFLI